MRWDDDRLVANNPLVGPPYVRNTIALFGQVQNEAYQPLHIASYQIDFSGRRRGGRRARDPGARCLDGVAPPWTPGPGWTDAEPR